MRFVHQNQGTCSRAVSFDINNGIVTNVVFDGGCNGNLKAIAKLVDKMPAQRIAELCLGNTCDTNPTSCADQLAQAVLMAAKQEKTK